MDTTDSVTTNSTGADAVDEGETEFVPESDPDDEFYAVVKTGYLRELLDVYAPTERNALFLVRDGVGLRARSKSYHCYLFEVEIPADAFETFQAHDLDLQVDTEAVGRAVSETQTARVELRGSSDGAISLRNGQRSYDLSTETFKPADDDNFPVWIEALERNQHKTWECTVTASHLRALVNADADHDHAGLILDGQEERLEVFFFDNDDESRTVSLALDESDFVSPPSQHHEGFCEKGVAAAPVCRESLDQVLPPIRGEVQVTVSEEPSILPPHIEYSRGEGTLTVYGWVFGREGAQETLDSILD